MGDEWCHWYADLQGQLYLQDAQGYYRQATAAQEQQWISDCEERLTQREAIQQKRKASLQERRKALSFAEGSSTDGNLVPHLAEIPVSGVVRGVVLLLEYQDVKFSMNDPLQHYTDQMMKPGYDYAYNATTKYRHKGSVHEYFEQCSNGIFDLQLEVFGPITLANNVKHYAANSDELAWEMITEGCQQINDTVDFSRFDNDGDGKIDFVAAIYAGPGSNASGVSESEAVWPHQWTISSAGGEATYVDSLLIDTYVCVNETYGGRPDGMGTFCHEFSHILGLPDLYSGSNCTPDSYDLMDNGAYNLNGYRPAALSAYERYEMGWEQPIILNEMGITDLSLAPTTMGGGSYMVTVTESLDDPREGEYYLFENRQPYLWDEYLPGHGMLIWHIDYYSSRWKANKPNSWSQHQCIDLVEADGKKTKSGSYTQDDTATFPGTANHTSFTPLTTPAFCGWANPQRNDGTLDVNLDKGLLNITEVPFEAEAYPSDVMAGATLNNLTFRYLPNYAGIQTVQMDSPADKPQRIVCEQGKVLIVTPTGRRDLLGRIIE